MTPEDIQDKKSVLEQFQKAKLEATKNTPMETPAQATTPSPDVVKPAATKPVFRPKIKPPGQTPPTT
jgi:hypothetical protein